MLGINFIGLNEKEDNLWEFLHIGKLISPLGTPDTNSIVVTSNITKDIPLTTDRPLRGLYERSSILRFGVNIEDNSFRELSESKLIVPTFSM